MLHILRRGAAGLSGSGAAHFAAHGERIDATNEQADLILILYTISHAMQVGISQIKTLYLSIDGGELLTQKECLLLFLLLFGERIINGGSDLIVSVLIQQNRLVKKR